MTIKQARQLAVGFGLSAVMAAGFAGCHNNAANAAEQSGDPAAANMAANGQPAQALAQNVQYSPQQQRQDYSPGYDNGQSSNDQAYYNDDLTDWESNEPPPPLPQYDQPPAPYPNYIWTPGYWAWGPYGYSWVPGYWVAPPYVGALWTPGYWGYWNGAYRFHHGYWARQIGFYGGIDYGFGYFGFGYDGGYWNGANFYYNTAYTRVDRDRVRYVYDHNDGRHGQGSGRVSFNGGRGGVQARPQAAEVTAMRGQRIGPMQTQVQVRDEASRNRQQSFSTNHGRPATAAAAQPLSRDRSLPAELPRAAAPGRNDGGRGQGQQSGPQNGQPMRQGGRQDSAPQGRPGFQPGAQEARPVQPQNEARPPQQDGNPQQGGRQRGLNQGRPQNQAVPQQQAAPQQHQAAPQEHQAAPQQHQAAPQQHQAAPQQHQAAPRGNQGHGQGGQNQGQGRGQDRGNGNDKKDH